MRRLDPIFGLGTSQKQMRFCQGMRKVAPATYHESCPGQDVRFVGEDNRRA
jgi:hypothetical protein